jgi:hypothetical protein
VTEIRAPDPATRHSGSPRALAHDVRDLRSMGRHAPKVLVGLLVLKAALALIATSGC